MRWIKHLTMAHTDESLSALAEEFGAEGYGIYWFLLEHIGATVEKDSDDVPTRTHSVTKWAQICHCSVRRFRKFVETTSKLRLIHSQTTSELRQNSSGTIAERIQIDVPNLLKYRDEYSKKSGQTPEQDRKQRESKEKADIPAADTLKEIGWLGVAKTPESVCDKIIAMRLDRFSEDARLDSAFMVYVRLLWFDEFFAYYPRKDDKRTARVAYFKAVETLAMKDLVEQAIIDQAPEILKSEKKFQPLAATWLNKERWNDSRSLLLEEAS